MRLFVGIPLPSGITGQLESLCARLRPYGESLRWSKPESWHITLQFLGSATESQFACVQARLSAIQAASLPIRVQGLGFFDRPGVFYADVLSSPALTRLQEQVVEATRPCGFVPEDRAYRPHITLARSPARGATGMAALRKHAGSFDDVPVFHPGAFLLYESVPAPGGSRYEERQHITLRT